MLNMILLLLFLNDNLLYIYVNYMCVVIYYTK